MASTGFTIDEFAKMLLAHLGASIRNDTGLNGLFAFDLQWTPDQLRGHSPDRFPSVDPNGPRIFVALQEQLGLRLDPD